MFDFVRSHTRLFQFLLLLVIFPSFVLVGIQLDRLGGADAEEVARVDGQKITRGEFDFAHRKYVERMRQQMPGVDVKLLDTPEIRKQTLEGLVRDRVLDRALQKFNLTVSDRRLIELMRADPNLASVRGPDGNIDRDMYLRVLAENGMSPVEFEASYKRRQVVQGVATSAFSPAAPASAAFDAFFQQREIQVQRFDPKEYAAKVSPTEADLDKFYKDPAHAAQFQAPEQAGIEYVVLDLEGLKKTVTVPEAELKNYYDQNAKKLYSEPEERRASHILVKADKNAPAEERVKAKAKAEQLLAEVKKNPASFAEVAKKNSDDPGSKERGGDLDYFGRGAMTPPFDEAVFALKPGELSGIVETDFGFHIIQLVDARGGKTKPFEQVRAQIEDDFRKQEAQKKFAQIASDFTNVVYEQSDSLKPVVEKFKLELRTAPAVKRTPTPDTPAPLNNPKLLDAIFSSDIIKNKRNTDAIETGPNQLVSARVVQHTPARTIPFADVKDKVREQVVAQQAAALARKEGEARLAELKKDPNAAMPGEPIVVSRVSAKNQPRQVVDAALRADASKLPAVAGTETGDSGYAVVRVAKVLGRDPVAADPQRAQAQYAQAWGAAEVEAFYNALKTRLKVKVDEKSVAVSTAASAPGK